MSMFGPKMGSWFLSSKLDPRWNATGRGMCIGMPDECEEKLKDLKEMYGELPKDLTWGYMKD